MFSSQINSRDLFFSNPVDHFLGNNGGLRTSGESGFNSSNYSQKRSSSINRNSKDLLIDSNNSHDIFSQSQKTNVGDQGTADYQKYISHNLLFGKAKKEIGKQNLKSFDYDDSEQQDKRLIIEENRILSEMTEIRNLLGSLAGGIQKIHSDLSVVQGSIKDVEEEISEQNERISSLDETLSNQAKSIFELEKQNKKNHKKDDSIMKIVEIITESTDDIKQELNKFEDMIKEDFPTGKILESVKKLATAQTNGNKKLLEDTKTHNERILKRIDVKIDKHCSEFKSILEKVKSEKSMEIKLDGIEECMNTMNTSVKNLIDTSKTSQLQNEFEEPMFFKTPAGTTLNESQKLRSNHTSLKRTNAYSQIPAHTPLANSFNQAENPYFLKSNKGNSEHKDNIEDEFERLLSTKPQRPIESRKLKSHLNTGAAESERLSLYSRNTVHTPLAKSINQSENSFSFKDPNRGHNKENTECKQSERSFFVTPQVQNIPIEYQKLRSRLHQQSANVSRSNVYTQNSFHTPLSKSISQSEASFRLRVTNQRNSTVNEPNARNNALNIKRKVSPHQSPGLGKSPSFSTKYIKNRSQIYGKPNNMRQQNYNGKNVQNMDGESDRQTQKSSPYLTMFEVANMVDEFNG